MKIELGNERLGSGGKISEDIHGYSRSTHNLGQIIRTSAAAGVLIPFMNQVALPGDTWDINLNADIKTHPTVGPLFGSFKVQLDVFLCPMRLYIASLMMNKKNVGKNVAQIKFPQLEMESILVDRAKLTDTYQIDPSSIFAHLGIRGLGTTEIASQRPKRQFNALPYIMYYDIFGIYYANKQEENAYFVNSSIAVNPKTVTEVKVTTQISGSPYVVLLNTNLSTEASVNSTTEMAITYSAAGNTPSRFVILISSRDERVPIDQVFSSFSQTSATIRTYREPFAGMEGTWKGWAYATPDDLGGKVVLTSFPLENLDTMREKILQKDKATPLVINAAFNLAPYSTNLANNADMTAAQQTMQGLCVKTYQSDVNNNWMNSTWVDGANGLNEITAVSTAAGKFTMDQLNLAKKIYEVLSRVMASGGTYEDYLEVTYDHKQVRKLTSPMYMGGLSKELEFQEVISNSDTANQPLGTLGGRGIMGKKHKGGKLHIKVDEPSYIIGIFSITPRIDYSQGNQWDVNLKTIDDLHKPALDQIGYQDKVTDDMAWWDTRIGSDGGIIFRSAGKQPSWINYMTNVNQVRGNFAKRDNEGFMVLTRDYNGKENARISDLSTYIDPVKSNYIFADTALDSQNFWVQTGISAQVRRKMSAKQMPNI